MRHPIIKSRKQLIRLWFEFYKLVLEDPNFQANLSKISVYGAWGNCRGKAFDDWWKEHSTLFGPSRVEEATSMSNLPNVLYVSIPLSLPVTQSLPEIKALIVEKQRSLLKARGIDPNSVKSTKAGAGVYELTDQAEIRGRTLNEILIVYSLWLSRGRPAINSEFCQAVIDHLRSRPRSKWIPHVLQEDPAKDNKGNLRFAEDQIRQIRRFVKRGHDICLAVSQGQFPGKSVLR